MEIVFEQITEKRLEVKHEDTKYSVKYDVVVGVDNEYRTINGEVVDNETNSIICYISKNYELSIRMTYGNEALLSEMSEFAINTLALLDEVIKNK